ELAQNPDADRYELRPEFLRKTVLWTCKVFDKQRPQLAGECDRLGSSGQRCTGRGSLFEEQDRLFERNAFALTRDMLVVLEEITILYALHHLLHAASGRCAVLEVVQQRELLHPRRYGVRRLDPGHQQAEAVSHL